MLKGIKLDLGFIRTDTLKDEALMEMLDHLGISYSEDNLNNLSCIITSTRIDNNIFTIGKNVIIADEIMPLDDIVKTLSGNLHKEGDNLSLDINEYENRILDSIRNVFHKLELPLVRKWLWPNFAKTCCILTHDVDWLSYSPIHKAVMRKKSPTRIIKLILKYLITQYDYGNNIPEILEIEINRKIKSTFFFMTEYGKDDKKGQVVKKFVGESGFEIGLHGTKGSHKNLTILQIELDELRRNINNIANGVRYHRLKFRLPLTWKIVNDACLTYDATYSDHNFGFKASLCYPFHPLDISNKQRFRILEIPTAFMDWIALNRKYSENQCKHIINKIMDSVEKYNGCFSVNFHNTYLNEDTFPEIFATYLWLLDELTGRGYWVTSAMDCCNWWIKRSTAKLNIELKDQELVGNSSLKDIPVVVEKANGETVYFILNESLKINLK